MDNNFSNIDFRGTPDSTIQTACESIVNLCSFPPYGITGNDLVLVVGDQRDLNPRYALTLKNVASKVASQVEYMDIPEQFDKPLTDE